MLARRGGGSGEAEAAKLRAALLEESMRVFLQNNALVRFVGNVGVCDDGDDGNVHKWIFKSTFFRIHR